MARILVVEDKLGARQALAEAAADAGAEVLTAESAADALRKIGANTFDVVLTDLSMETAQGGLDVLRAAKDKDVYTQVIVITAHGTPEISVRCMRLGAFDYLDKNSPGTDVFAMVTSKVRLALEFRKAKLAERIR